jgi:aldehyde dehydrogenase (NAD+)
MGIIQTEINSQTRPSDIIAQQRLFFSTGVTHNVSFRIEQLKKLEKAIEDNKLNIVEALKADLNKPGFEAYFEMLGVLNEIKCALKHIKAWTKPRKISTPFHQFPSSAQVHANPLGVVLIIGPWNYPINLMLAPLVGAIAAGNCSILKPSEIAPHTASALKNLIASTFDPSFITTVEGDAEISQQLLKGKFDHIFFTGGTEVGKIVMSAASENLTPVTLELGGKSPCIVDETAHLEYSAKRIVWGKFTNAGQICTAPDYLLVNHKIKHDFLNNIKKQIRDFYGTDPSQSNSYARIINRKHFDRLSELLQSGECLIGGDTDLNQLYIAPTVIDQITLESKVMQEEIFGPILPVLEYENLAEAIALVNQKTAPLALYFFSRNSKNQAQVLRKTTSGSVCINDTVMQLTVPDLPFGGIGNSGFGRYHGKAGFDNFSFQRGILNKSFFLDLKWRYPPYSEKKKH